MKLNVVRRTNEGIYIRITSSNKTKFVSLGFSVEVQHWNSSSRRARKSHPGWSHVNSRIADALKICQEVEVMDLSLAEAQAAVREKVSGNGADFFEFARGVISGYWQRGQFSTGEHMRVAINKAERFNGGPLPFNQLTSDWIELFSRHLRDKVGNHPNTVAKNLKDIRTLVNHSIRAGKVPQRDNPFWGVKITHKQTDKLRLTLEELQRLIDLDLDPASWAGIAKNAWLFSMYCAGIRFSDLALLSRAENVRGDRLEYVMGKTGRQRSVKLLPQAIEIMNLYDTACYYLFPLLSRKAPRNESTWKLVQSKNALINKNLKKVAELAGLPKGLTFHVSRHTFADLARKNDWSIYDISKGLGHANIRVTEKYLAGFDQDSLDRRMDELFA